MAEDLTAHHFEKLETRVLDLGMYVSLAARVEPALLRRARLQFLPDHDSSVEADLWFSPLVETRGMDGITFKAEAAEFLRRRLVASHRDDLELAGELVADHHAYLSPEVRIEERVIWRALARDESGVEKALTPLRDYLLDEDVQFWAANALPRLPPAVKTSRTARALHVASQRSFAFTGEIEWMPPMDRDDPDLGTLLHDVEMTEVRVRQAGGKLTIGPDLSGDGTYRLPVLKTSPLQFEMMWSEGPREHLERIVVGIGESVSREVGDAAVTLRTMAGEEFLVPRTARETAKRDAVEQMFAYDVYLSYARPDDAPHNPGAGQAGWATTFRDHLAEALTRWLGRPGRVGMDTSLAGGEKFETKAKETVERAATLVCILSHAYSASEWARWELETFQSAAEADLMDRIFVVVLDDESSVVRPKLLLDLRAYELWDRDRETGRVRHLGATKSGAEDSEYGRRLDDLARDIASRLKELGQDQEVEQPGQARRILTGHRGPVWSVAVSRNGRWIASGSADGTVRVWEAENGHLRHTLEGHESTVFSVAFSDNGSYLASGSKDGALMVWEVESGKALHEVPGTSPVYSVQWRVKEVQQVLYGTGAGEVGVYEMLSGKRRVLAEDLGAPVLQVAEELMETVVVGTGDGRVQRLGRHGAEVVTTLKEAATSVVVSEAEQSFLSASYDGGIRSTHRSGVNPEVTIGSHGEPVWRLALSPDGRYVASGGWDGRAKIWRIVDGQRMEEFAHDLPVCDLAFDPEGRHLVVGCDDARVYDYQLNPEEWEERAGDGEVRYHSAAIVMAGARKAGKTQLAMTLAGGGSGAGKGGSRSHVVASQIEIDGPEGDGRNYEAVLWELPGASEGRWGAERTPAPDLGLVVVSAESKSDLREDVREGARRLDRLRAATAGPAPKLLIVVGSDRRAVEAGEEELRGFSTPSDFVGGCSVALDSEEDLESLRDLIRLRMPWGRIPWTVTTESQYRLRNEILDLVRGEPQLLPIPEVGERVSPSETAEEEEVRGALAMLHNQGRLVMLEFGDLVLFGPRLLAAAGREASWVLDEEGVEFGGRREVLERELLDRSRKGSAAEQFGAGGARLLTHAALQDALQRARIYVAESKKGWAVGVPVFGISSAGERFPDTVARFRFEERIGPSLLTALLVRLHLSGKFRLQGKKGSAAVEFADERGSHLVVEAHGEGDRIEMIDLYGPHTKDAAPFALFMNEFFRGELGERFQMDPSEVARFFLNPAVVARAQEMAEHAQREIEAQVRRQGLLGHLQSVADRIDASFRLSKASGYDVELHLAADRGAPGIPEERIRIALYYRAPLVRDEEGVLCFRPALLGSSEGGSPRSDPKRRDLARLANSADYLLGRAEDGTYWWTKTESLSDGQGEGTIPFAGERFEYRTIAD